MELDDAYFGGESHGPGKPGRGTDQDPVVVAVSVNEQGHPQYAFLEVVANLKQETVREVLKRRGDQAGVWLSDGAAVYAAGAKAHHADHRVTLSREPNAPQGFHWMNTVISLAKTFMDGPTTGADDPRKSLTRDAPDGNGIWMSLRIDLIVGTWEPGSPTAYLWRG